MLQMPVTMAQIGEKLVIRKITGRDDVRQHLAELGFVVGTSIMVVSSISGNLIIQVRDSRVALDKEMANRIII
jgi:ferrous iron transport protein A